MNEISFTVSIPDWVLVAVGIWAILSTLTSILSIYEFVLKQKIKKLEESE